MYTYSIKESKTIHSISTDGYQTEITIDVFKDDVFFETKKFGFELGTTKEEILIDLDKVMKTLESDDIISSQSAELDKKLTEAELLNKSILDNK